MKKYILIFVFIVMIMSVLSAASAQDDYDNWVENQQRLINEGYATIFDTYAYQNGDYVILDDGSIAIGVHPTTEEERNQIESDYNNSSSRTKIDRISPTPDIGLFIDPDLFRKALQKTPVYDFIYEQETEPYFVDDDVIKSITTYKIEGGAKIVCWINNYDRIHAIRIVVEPWYLLEDDCFEIEELTYYILQCTDLVHTEDDRYAATAVRQSDKKYVGRNFYVRYFIDDPNYNVEINTIYYSKGNSPFAMMDKFTDHACDLNYIGACIPIVSYDLDCSDMPVRNFFVTGNDTHLFDGDGNGVCCEPYPNYQ